MTSKWRATPADERALRIAFWPLRMVGYAFAIAFGFVVMSIINGVYTMAFGMAFVLAFGIVGKILFSIGTIIRSAPY